MELFCPQKPTGPIKVSATLEAVRHGPNKVRNSSACKANQANVVPLYSFFKAYKIVQKTKFQESF